MNSLLVSRTGDLWIGTDDRGIIRQSGSTAINVSEQAGFYQERIRGLFEDATGTIWAATHDGIERITVHGGTQSIELLDKLGPVSGDITTPFAEDGHGGIFVLTSDGVFHLTSRGVHTHVLEHHELHHLTTGDAVAIYYDRRGVLWVGLRDGLVRLTPSVGKGNRNADDEYTQEVVRRIQATRSPHWLATTREICGSVPATMGFAEFRTRGFPAGPPRMVWPTTLCARSMKMMSTTCGLASPAAGWLDGA